jgi:hypothetical protein
MVGGNLFSIAFGRNFDAHEPGESPAAAGGVVAGDFYGSAGKMEWGASGDCGVEVREIGDELVPR